MTAIRRLRRLELLSRGVGESTAHLRDLAASPGAIGVRRVLDRDARDVRGLARGRTAGRRRGGSAARRGRRRPRPPGRRRPRRTSSRARRHRRPPTRRAPPGRSRASWRSWRRRSRRALARADVLSRTSLSAPSGEELGRLVGAVGAAARERTGQALLDAHEPLAHALAQLPGRHAREGDEQQLVERRALGHVARRQGGDRVRLAGAGARLQHGHAGRERAARRRTAGPSRRPAHRSSISSWASSPSHMRRARRPTRVRLRDLPALALPRPARGGSASSSSRLRTPPSTSWCSGSLSSLSQFHSDAHAFRAAATGSRPGGGCLGVGGGRLAVERKRLPHPTVVEVEERREVPERSLAAARRRRRRAARSGRPATAASPGARPIVAAANGRSGWAAVNASSRTHAATRCLAESREKVTVRTTSPATPGHGPASAIGRRRGTRTSIEPGACVRLEQRLGRLDDLARRSGTRRRSPAGRGTPGGSEPRAISARIAGRPSTPASRASTSRCPTPHLPEAVELDGKVVLDLLEVVSDADPESLPQERPNRMLREADEILDLDQLGRSSAATARTGRPRAPRAARPSARAPSSVTLSKLQVRAGTSRPSWKLRGSNGWRGWRTSTRSRAAPVSTRTVASITSSSSPTGTAGGRGVFVRSSLPV